MPFFSRPRHSTSVERRPVDCLPAFGFFRLPRGVPRMLYQTHTNLRCRWPVWNQTPFVMDEGKSDSSTLQKTVCYTVGLAVRIFPATMRTFTKDTARSEQGRGAAWHVWINARRSRERHGSVMGSACHVWIGLYPGCIHTADELPCIRVIIVSKISLITALLHSSCKGLIRLSPDPWMGPNWLQCATSLTQIFPSHLSHHIHVSLTHRQQCVQCLSDDGWMERRRVYRLQLPGKYL
jgi:hypothetical protein